MKSVGFSLVVVIFCAAILVAFKSPQEPFPVVKSSSYTPAQIEKGRYLVQIMGCADCHAPKKMTAQGPIPDPDLGLSGHPAQIPVPLVSKDALANWVLFSPMSTLAIGPWGASFSANLTPDITGIGNWTEAQFIVALTQGKSKGIVTSRPLLPPMPWQNYVDMKKDDLVAMFAYLKSCKPIDNLVPQPISPDKL
jgi:hypothetical protein